MKNRFSKVFVLTLLILIVATAAVSAQEATTSAEPQKSGLAIGLIAIAAALAIGVTALGTAIAQGRIGSAGTIAERPESAGTIIILIAIPETMVILGFIVSVIILFTL